MSLSVAFKRAAKDELEEPAAWYEERQRGLGEELLSEVEEAIERAANHPTLHPVVYGDVRRAVLRRFP